MFPVAIQSRYEYWYDGKLRCQYEAPAFDLKIGEGQRAWTISFEHHHLEQIPIGHERIEINFELGHVMAPTARRVPLHPDAPEYDLVHLKWEMNYDVPGLLRCEIRTRMPTIGTKPTTVLLMPTIPVPRFTLADIEPQARVIA